MAAIVKEFTSLTTPENVFKALTQQDEIERWWATDLSVRPEVGSRAEFRFRQRAFVLQLEIAELVANEKVLWLARKVTPIWEGTRITWQITPVENGTKVHFNHDGFAQADKGYEQVRENWEYFLASLKSYLETGKGTPGDPPLRP